MGALGAIRKEHTDFEPISVQEEDGGMAKPTLDFTFEQSCKIATWLAALVFR